MALFENDGCTFWPDQWRGVSLSDCCAVHDEAFAYGRSFAEFLQANVGLFQCGVAHGAWEWAALAFAGVMTLGAPMFFLGRKKVRNDPPCDR